ncbi:N-acetylmuramoyl-L-alanine amidase [Desulfonispora thiosulfatigenes DSM 11270]|uniref:N-acetylmuramoyl-L-alanine amidase n=1 Tax=Desulfonispora thiosulfatigenes DSM 11270 TaxID=656914 RepID=A0A1W1US93_DESTI|nr:N-acetylmuramoyl-L-alanine amidase [Desulfonispora thiosulfatigenes]SMB83604.1 N-acetylmuramoyl-L-alanine amidase [Desulfonispora thiosulfatigenes DSM 11270]
MKLKLSYNSKKVILFGTVLSIFVVSCFTYLFYSYGKETEHLETLSWVVAGKKVVIDPGHGGIFPGKINDDNIMEKDVNLAVSKQLQFILQEAGARVLLTREDDSDLVDPNENGKLIQKLRTDLQKRVQIAKDNEADLFISIHCNSIPSPKWQGAQTFYDPHNEESKLIATNIQKEIIAQLKNTKRQALARQDTFLFENLEIPAIIIELGFLSNPEESDLLNSSEYQYRIAYAIHSGLIKHLAEKSPK